MSTATVKQKNYPRGMTTGRTFSSALLLRIDRAPCRRASFSAPFPVLENFHVDSQSHPPRSSRAAQSHGECGALRAAIAAAAEIYRRYDRDNERIRRRR